MIQKFPVVLPKFHSFVFYLRTRRRIGYAYDEREKNLVKSNSNEQQKFKNYQCVEHAKCEVKFRT